ncbi:hypothetical protein [Nocardia noduli]|uniref:hypothetical protein n=1 Tax=Nocardia noduli TaxID=2815722 RepID=UPI001C22FCF1|nr:hypothetical protein [Nocardia noduli]
MTSEEIEAASGKADARRTFRRAGDNREHLMWLGGVVWDSALRDRLYVGIFEHSNVTRPRKPRNTIVGRPVERAEVRAEQLMERPRWGLPELASRYGGRRAPGVTPDEWVWAIDSVG